MSPVVKELMAQIKKIERDNDFADLLDQMSKFCGELHKATDAAAYAECEQSLIQASNEIRTLVDPVYETDPRNIPWHRKGE